MYGNKIPWTGHFSSVFPTVEYLGDIILWVKVVGSSF